MTPRVSLAPGTRLHRGPVRSLLVGGSPTRVLALGPPADAALARWGVGVAPTGAAERRLALRLHALGVLTLREPSRHTTAEVTVVVPARDRLALLARCLARIGPCARLLVIDDASADPEGVRRVARQHGAVVLRRACNGGPAAARNTGLEQAATPFVAFVDSDCLVPSGWLADLLACLVDDRIVLVAPRVIGSGTGLLARFEVDSGPLDLGAVAGPVALGARVGYVPAAVLLARRAALTDGFDESLRIGEDVDLVWRLIEAGWRVRYEPHIVVPHATRSKAGPWLAQRYGYGTSAADLDRRHPGALAPARVSRAVLPVLIAAGLGRPGVALTAGAIVAAVLRQRLPAGPGRTTEAVRLTVTGLGLTAAGLAEAACRAWSPALLAACLVSTRARTLTSLAVYTRLAPARYREQPQLPPLPWAALRLADDLAYAAGLWAGALRGGRLQVLLPRLGRAGLSAAGQHGTGGPKPATAARLQ